ncbi:MAG: nucleotidyl transferase AbiEii/AbiGii toxin family protein [Acidobacteriota bacterium]
MTFLDRVFQALNAASARFVVVGGVAVVLHGHARFTKDLDLILDFEPAALRRAIEALVSLGLRPMAPVDPADFARPEVRRQWAAEKGMVVFSLRDWDNPLHVVDLFIEHPGDFEVMWQRSSVMQVAGGDVRVAAIEDLIALKRAADRDQDRLDIARLEEIAQQRRES